MLRRNIRLIHGQGSQSELEVQFQEITHFQSNFQLMATVSALLAGFEFTVYAFDTTMSDYSEIQSSSIVYMCLATASLCVNIIVVCLATLASMLGPGLALRGPEGSVKRALDGMRDEYKRVVALFLTGAYSFFLTVIAIVWFYYFWIVAAPCTCVVLYGALSLYRGIGRVSATFALEGEALQALTISDKAPAPEKSTKSCASCGAVCDVEQQFCQHCGKSDLDVKVAPQADQGHGSGGSNHLKLPHLSAPHLPSFKTAERSSTTGAGREEPLLDRDALAPAVAPLEKRGHLFKRGHVRKNWTRRFFQVREGAIVYFDKEDGRMLRAIRLSGASIRCAPFDAVEEKAPRRHAFALVMRDTGYRLDLCADSESDMAAWILAISRNSNAAFAPKPLHVGVLSARKRNRGEFRSFHASLTCANLTLSDDGDTKHEIVVASTEPWDGKGLVRKHAHGILVRDENKALWQLTARSQLEREQWLKHLTGCCGSYGSDLSVLGILSTVTGAAHAEAVAVDVAPA